MSDPKEQLQRDVERTRRELGETVEALAHKADVPGRVKEQAHERVVRMTAAPTRRSTRCPSPSRGRSRRHAGTPGRSRRR